MTKDEEELEEEEIPECLVPIDIKNRTYCGAGATIILSRAKVNKESVLLIKGRYNSLLRTSNNARLQIQKRKIHKGKLRESVLYCIV